MHFIDLPNINIGDVVAVSVKDSSDRLLISAGKAITNKILNHLKDIGISGIYIEDDITDNFIPEETIPKALQNETINNLKNLNIDKALNNANSIVDNLKENELCEFLNLKTFNGYTYEHSISVAVYSTLIGIAANYKQDELYKLATAGLLHDIGKMSISNEIINKPGKLTYDEYEEIKRHPEYGFYMLKDSFEISATIKMGIYEHHENEDGTGYPRNLTGDKIYKFAKIIHICDVYDALISKRPYKEPFTPKESLDYIEQNIGKMFDKKYVDIFKNVVPAYPKGLLVTLSNEEKGIVIENHVGAVLRPTIKLMTGKTVNLFEDEKYKDIYII